MEFETVLQQRKIGYEKHSHPTMYTSQGLANAEHVSGYMVAKPVIVKGAHEFTMCVLPAPQHADLKRIAEVLEESVVRLATETEMSALFGDCELGAEPPVGALFDLKTVVDRKLLDDEFLMMQAGTHTDAVKLRREDWQKLCEPIIADIAGN